jgi:hypothetical protein
MPAHSAAKHFTANEVYEATGVRPSCQYQWHDRGVTSLSRRDKLSSGSGDPHLKSFATIAQYFIVKKLTDLRVRPKDAARAARKFTDEGQPGRKPGELFEHFKTVLVVTEDGASVLNVGFDPKITDATGHSDCAVIIDLNSIVKSLNENLSKLKGRK